ncbi:chitooligosaccharidolytic beta-N-acetylglucosaminidase [Amyelois transitella]|uniref:chitooligosaccharidolytic beta-N-acetylglucosaminidase n=1 Tax=Amyelois transitella TaxID=680683 RepID=UPI00298FE654|nr:chitooligosaccharidolytic beta-N-acetylglucosaminidase [Amyelois transitella]XP_013190819.2 chitooligosaccharidolytic beta-N-acetylglucosaminidase [Amyelois transitella]XP_060802604.1 chitooligosaccharidolytic beta-N-acetylglucosaminidase [Amyelois transitella]XP_060802605.1 chitooligosaccharidolytic beta-N-acetylglucosaminidase [Amyelois transitella]
MAGWVLPLVLAAHLVHCNDENTVKDVTPIIYEPSWVYKCVTNEGCQRSNRPHPSSSSNSSAPVFESLDHCRLVCGRFGGLWPRPVSATLSMQTVSFHPNYLRYDLHEVPAEARAMLAKMTQVTSANLLAECGRNVTKISTTPVVVYLTVKSPDLSLTWDTDEEYVLDVQTKDGNVAVRIIGETIYGVRHGLESFSQLVAADKPEFSDEKECGLRMVTGAKIRDRPVYKHRGLVLDTSRNFIPMKDIKRTIDGLAATKMNVFHWHVTDSHSFPLESTRVPQFTRYGAYSSSEIYSAKEVRDLVEYAQIRGVRVVIEIDAPAHAGNGWQWGNDYGYGDLAVCVNSQPWRNLCIQPPCGQLNPANEVMYKVLRNLYRDIAEVLPKPALFHMGGDEVFFGCWNSSQDIQSYMANKGFSLDQEGFIRLWAEFHAKSLQIWDEELVAEGAVGNQPVMLWSSELTQAHRIQKYLNKDRYVIEVWEPLSSPLLTQLLKMGYRVVSVPKDIWYLDHGFWGTTRFSNWRRMYSHILPRDPGVLGGEVAMWSEYMDAQVLDTRVWPRAAAVGERLWSDPPAARAPDARLHAQRARLVARGLAPDAISPGWCQQHDGKCL